MITEMITAGMKTTEKEAEKRKGEKDATEDVLKELKQHTRIRNQQRRGERSHPGSTKTNPNQIKT